MVLNRILIYALMFFILSTIGMTAFAIYRGIVISRLEYQLLSDRTTNVTVTLNSQKVADDISNKIQTDLTNLKVQKEVFHHETEKIITNPIYINQCIDNDGLYYLNKAITDPASIASEPVGEMR